MLKTKKVTIGGTDGQQCSYSRRKVEKQTKIKFEDNVTDRKKDNGIENQRLVDLFVQEVIEKAKREYLRQCNGDNGIREDKSGETVNSSSNKDQENSRVAPEQSSKKSNKEKQKRRHHYKYSAPVDEKEISEYEQQDEEAPLQMNPNFGNVRKEKKNPTTRNRFYSQTVSTFRRVLGCCFGKT